MAPTAHAPPGTSRPGPPDPHPGLLICDQLDILVTCDPIAELDAALAPAAARLRAAHARTAVRPLRWINTRLDQRTSFTGG